MTWTRLLIPAALTATTLLAGCGGDTTPKVDTSNARSIAKALQDAGFVCVGYSENKQAIGPTSSGTCMHAGREVGISTFNSAEDRQRITEQVQRAFGETPGPSRGRTSVAAETWLVTTSSQVDADGVQKVLGGSRE